MRQWSGLAGAFFCCWAWGQTVDATTQSNSAPLVQTEQDIDVPDSIVATLFDGSLPVEQRKQAYEQVQQFARRKSGEAFFLMGALYAAGKEHPAALFDQDTVRAKQYWSNAAANSWTSVMPMLAELELSLGNPQAAIVWAHLSAHYSRPSKDESETQKSQKSRLNLYSADLLTRCREALGDAYDQDATLAGINQFIGRYDEAIRGQWALRTQRDSKPEEEGKSARVRPYAEPKLAHAVQTREPKHALMTDCFVASGRTGVVKRALTIAYMPNSKEAREGCAQWKNAVVSGIDDADDFNWAYGKFSLLPPNAFRRGRP